VYELLGICLVAASLADDQCHRISSNSGLLAPPATAVAELLSSDARRDLFALRVSPPALALISVTLFLCFLCWLRAYTTSEIVSKKLAALAILSAIGVTLALSRALRSWFATRTLLQEWLSSAVQNKAGRDRHSHLSHR